MAKAPNSGRKRREPICIFDSKVRKTNGCWLWNGYIMNAGYGAMTTHEGSYLAHRWAYEYFVGKIPQKMTIDHLCKNKLCVKPEHLEVVTRTENIQRAGLRGVAKKESEKTRCPKNHSYEKHGVVYKNGYTKYGTVKYARRCTVCYPFYKRFKV